MPKVSAAHLEARRQQILAAARACFAKDGFHRATMHDVVREAGLSAGAVYRYFPSKEAIVEALAEERHRREDEAIARAARGESAGDALAGLARAFLAPLAAAGEREERRLGIQLWAEALRDARLRRIVRSGVDGPRARIAAILRPAKLRGELPASLDPDDAARIVIALFHGVVLQQAWDPALDVARLASTLEAAARALLRPPGRTRRPARGRPS